MRGAGLETEQYRPHFRISLNEFRMRKMAVEKAVVSLAFPKRNVGKVRRSIPFTALAKRDAENPVTYFLFNAFAPIIGTQVHRRRLGASRGKTPRESFLSKG